MPRTSGTRPKSTNGGAKGAGWGGDRKGKPEKASKAAAFKPGNRAYDAAVRKRKAALGLLTKAERKKELELHLLYLSLHASHEETQVNAASKLHAIDNGQPVARNINAEVDDVSKLTDDELRAELEAVGGTGGAPAPRKTPPRVPG